MSPAKRKKRLIGWKKVTYSRVYESAILKLEILGPVSRPDFGPKRRTNEVKVLAAYSMSRRRLPRKTVFHSMHNYDFLYRVGRERRLLRYEAGRFDINGPACSTGIHFFFNRRDAETYWTY